MAVPLVTMGNNDSWPETSLTAGTGRVVFDTENLVVLDSAHPVATGLPSTFAPADTPGLLQSVNEAYLVDGADPVAARQGQLGKHVVYTVNAGGALKDGYLAPAARVVLGYTAETLTDLSDDGLELLDNAIYWADDTAAPTWQGREQATLEQRGRWVLDKMPIRGSTRYTRSATAPGTSESQPGDDGILNIDTHISRVANVARSGARALDFPGWNDGDSNNLVHVNDSSVRIPDRNYFDPATKNEFMVSVYVRPDNAASAGQLEDTASPNIVQKGLATDPAQWKSPWRKTCLSRARSRALSAGCLSHATSTPTMWK